MPALKYWDTNQSAYVLLMPGATTFPFTYTTTLAAPTVASSPYQINHNLNTTTPLVQIYDAVTGQQVMAQIRVVNANSIQISVTANMPNSVNVIVVGSAQAPVATQPANLVTLAQLQAVTPALPAPVTSGTTIQSFTDSLGDVWVAKNGVRSGNWYRARDVLHCRYYRNAAGAQVTGSIQALPYDTAQFDYYGLFSTSTLLLTAPVAGLWYVYANYSIAAPASTPYFMNLMIRYGAAPQTAGSTGTRIMQMQAPIVITTTGTYIGGQVFWPCNSGDQFWIEVYSTSGGLPYSISASSILTYMGASYVGTG